MRTEILQYIVCPCCEGGLSLQQTQFDGDLVCKGSLRCAGCNKEFPVLNYIPRFVEKDNYADSFGRQWNKYKRVQLDRYSETTISRDRFYDVTRWSPEELKGKTVLDVGCGAGRFTQIALDAGATVVAFDLSDSVDACLDNLREYDNLHVVQADIFKMPFRKDAFDYIFSIGVLQHTPDPLAAFQKVIETARPQAKLAFWMYGKSFKSLFRAKHLFRPFLKNLPVEALESTVRIMVRLLFPVAVILLAVPCLGRIILRAFPIACAHLQGLGIKTKDLKDWVLLDTFDMYAPTYDHPQRFEDVWRILKANCTEASRTPIPGIGVAAIK